MKVALIGPAHDIHLWRWGQALREAGADVLFVGIEEPPSHLHPYLCIGPPIKYPTLWDFLERRHLLRKLLTQHKIELAHPIHLTPSGLWVWSSGFRPYVPYAMGADILEYAPSFRFIHRSWNLQSVTARLQRRINVWIRRKVFPFVLRRILSESVLSMGDNYEICFSKKFFEKNKTYIEMPTGISLSPKVCGAGRDKKYIFAPRGATLLYQADIVLKAFRLYLERGGKHALMLISGLYPAHPTIRQAAMELRDLFSENFIFLEKSFSSIEINNLWAEAVAFISAPVYDGYSYAVAEGRMHGALPIVNAIPAHLEILTHGYNAWFVEPFTPERLADALLELEPILEGPPFWQARNQEWIEKFSNLVENARLFLKLVESALRLHSAYT
ncbi:MAG: hypothetical protein NZZ60_02320 [Bacteroidia bacterium]|nr:hypothetical protein [Bacteroidia bacterium]MDW8417341.1 hypothetical protein [Bacteroidia bacterium]